MTPCDFFVFGATSELAQHLFTEQRAWFLANVRRLILVQRTPEVSAAYEGFEYEVVQADVSDATAFSASLAAIVEQHASHDRPMHVFPTYGRFSWDYAKKSPRFAYSEDGLQINLNCRLQIIEAFRPYAKNTKLHLLGSLFANFPYTGDYALSMWYVNQLPANPAYADLDLRVYNLGGMKTRFWKHEEGPKNNPFLHDEIPTKPLIEAMAADRRGVQTFYPSAVSRFACWLGRRGVKVL